MSHALFKPVAGRAYEILDFIMQTEEVQAHPSLAYNIRLSCEEVIVNIINYAYPIGAGGYIELSVTVDKKKLCIEIEDGGTPFNPIEKEEPDVTQEPEKRPIGGLGIFLVLQMMDEVIYCYEDGRNKLTLIKEIEDTDGNE